MGSQGTARFAITSPAQDDLWKLATLAPGSPAHTVCRAYRVTGPLDVTALHAAWRAVVSRHESLRGTFVRRAGRLMLRIAADPPRDTWSYTDLVPRAEPPDAVARAVCADVAATPMRLTEGPLARLVVTRLGPADHVVVLAVHRAIADDMSISIVVDELSAGYASAVAGTRPVDALPAPPRRTAEHHAREQRARDHRRLLDWWRATLTPLPTAPDLPVDHARAPSVVAPAGTERFDWRSQLGEALVVLAAHERVRPPTVLLATFQLLLHRYGGGQPIAIGMPAATRPLPELAGVVGQFDTLLVVRVDATGSLTFRELLRQVDAAVTDALAHAVPYGELARGLDLRPPTALCEVMVVVREPEPLPRLAGSRVTRHPVDTVATLADLTLTIDASSGAGGSLEYRTDVVKPWSARLILRQVRTLLAAALRDPDLPVRALPLESRDRLRAAIRAADRVAEGSARLDPVTTMARAAALRTPDAPALSFGGTQVSYAELRSQAARVTAALTTGPGTVSGKPVAVRMTAGPRQIAALLGVLDGGAHLVCLGTDEVGERGRTLLADLRPACLVVDGAAGPDELARWYADELGGRVVDVATPPDPAAVTGATASAHVTPRDRAYIAFTSGSTGRPKGIPHCHATLAQFVTWFAGEFRIGPGSRVAQWAAPGYDASLCETFATLVAGATLCPVPSRIRANPEKIIDWLVTERITHFQTVPSFAREILRVIRERHAAPEHLGHLLLAGEALPGELAGRLRAALPYTRLINLYGPTELILATWHEVVDGGPGVAPVGRSIPGRQVLVLDDQDQPCPAGVTGAIVVRGPHITSGYLGPATADRTPFRPIADAGDWGIGGACYRTGDLGRWRFDGTLEFRGRTDFQVKFHGIRLELGDIEAALAAHPSVAECAVLAETDATRMVTRLVAHVVPVRGSDTTPVGTPADWRAALRARFGSAMPPVSFRVRTSLPRTISGKIDRTGLLASPPTSRHGASEAR